jgi:hypothetical protein
MNITGWIKEHPMGTAAVVGVVAVAAFFLLRGSGSSAAPSQQATDVANSLATQQLNAESGIAMAQIAAQNANTTAAAGVENAKTQAALQASLAQTDVIKTYISNAADISKLQLTNQAAEVSTLTSNLPTLFKNIGGSQNRLSLVQSILGQEQAAEVTQESNAAINNPKYGAGAVAAGIAGTASKTLLGLFA